MGRPFIKDGVFHESSESHIAILRIEWVERAHASFGAMRVARTADGGTAAMAARMVLLNVEDVPEQVIEDLLLGSFVIELEEVAFPVAAFAAFPPLGTLEVWVSERHGCQ